MTMGISLAVITAAVVALVVFLIITLQKLNKVLDRTSFLVENLNQNLPSLITDLRTTSSNLNTISEGLAQGVQSVTAAASEGADYFKSFKLFGTLFDTVALIRKGIKLIRKFTKEA